MMLRSTSPNRSSAIFSSTSFRRGSILVLTAAAAVIVDRNLFRVCIQTVPYSIASLVSKPKQTEVIRSQGCSSPTPDQRQLLASRTHDLLHSPLPDEEYYAALLDEIHSGCGQLCTNDTNRRVPLDSADRETYFDYRVVADVKCCELFAHPLLDAPAVRWPPPKKIPEAMKEEFLGFRDDVEVSSYYLQERFSGGEAATSVFTKEEVEELKQQSMEGKLIGNYGGKGTAKLRAYVAKYCNDKHVAVVGSKSPWVEAILLGVGARHVTTIEYGAIKSQHPNVTALTNAEFNEKYLDGSLEPFDAFVSFSSMEHAGLGRYGDSLNPWGDVIMASKMHCALKPGGLAIIGVPTHEDGSDSLRFNADRQYGKARWPLFLTNYRPLPQLQFVGLEYYHQDIVVAKAV